MILDYIHHHMHAWIPTAGGPYILRVQVWRRVGKGGMGGPAFGVQAHRIDILFVINGDGSV